MLSNSDNLRNAFYKKIASVEIAIEILDSADVPTEEKQQIVSLINVDFEKARVYLAEFLANQRIESFKK